MKRYLYRFLGMTCLSVFLSTTAFTQHIEQTKRLNTSELRSEEAVTSFDANSESNQSPLEQYSGKREDLSKRDLFSKHFINEDGSYTAIIGAGPIHYEKNGEFLDINHTVVTNSSSEFPFANTTNLMESYFGATSAAGIRSVTAEGEVREFLNTRLYWEVNGQPYEIEEAASVPASIVSGNGVVYPNLFGNISAEYTVLTGKRELNYVIPNAQALGAIPTNATYLVFAEDIELPMGWTFEENNSGILLKSANGNNVYLYENPRSTDALAELTREKNTHFATELNGNILTVYTKVKTEWLLDSERVYPVKVDPTTNVTPDNANYWSISVYDDGDESAPVGYYGRSSGYWLSYFVKFNTTSIASGSTVSDVKGYRNQTGYAGTRAAASQWNWANSADPTTTSGTALYNSQTALQATSINTNNTNGWKNVTFTAGGRTYVSNGINSQGYVALSVYPAGTWNATNYYANDNHTSANRPYLAVTYTAPAGPPSCATPSNPVNAATAVAPNQNTLVWNAVGGATSYDVYFGASPTPPLVASNVATTNYTINDCMSPSTTYYWKVVPKNANGSATGCATWSFTTDNKLHLYSTDFESASPGFFGTSGTSVDGWYTNNNIGTGGTPTSGYNNTWTVGNGTFAISGMSAGLSGLYNGGLVGSFFECWTDLGEIHRWIYRPINATGFRDIEVNFRWRCGGESNQDYGSVATSIDNGANWLTDTQGGLNSDGKYWNSPSTIRTQSLVFPDTRNNQSNFQLAFKWDDLSGNGYSADPTFVVDDIFVKACPYEGTISSTAVGSGVYEWSPSGNSQTTLTINGTFQCASFQWEQSTNNGASWVNAVGGSGATTSSYTTPSDITSETWYRCKVYFGTGCTGAYQDNPFKIINFNCDTVDNLEATLGDPANGLNHYLNLNWTALSGASGYDVQFSTDGTTYTNATPASVNTNSAILNAGDYPNAPYWFRVRAKNVTETCDWTYVGPIYTAADLPEVPLITNAAGTSLDLTLQAETPVANPAITTYSIVCPTTGQFVQANGTLGATEVFQTKAQWGTVTVTGLTTNSSYCFYAKAKNQDGDVTEGGSTNTPSWGPNGAEDFDSYGWYSYCGLSITSLDNWMPCVASGNGTTWTQTASDGCTGNAVQYTSTIANAGSLLRSPKFDATGLNSITVSFDMTNSYNAAHTADRIYLYVGTWSYSGGFYNSYTDPNAPATQSIYFDKVRNCERVSLTFDISAMNAAYKSNMTIGIWSTGTASAHNFNVVIDNFSVGQLPPTACATLTAAVAPKFYDYGGSTQLAFNNSRSDNGTPVFRLSHSMGAATDYQIEINTSPAFSAGGTTQTFSGSYPANTQANFTFTNATLSNGTTYYVRARINTGLGYGAWTSGTYSFTYSTTQDSPDWFQTTQAQFQTGTLSGTEANASNNVVATIAGGGGGALTNANFNGNTNGWTITGANTSWNLYASAIGSSDGVCSSCNPLPGATNLRMGSPLFGTSGPISGDRIIVAQQVDLTGVSSISFDVSAWYNLGSPFYSEASTVLKFKIGGTLTNATGGLVDMTVQTQPSSYSYTSPHTVTVNTEGISGVQIVKFVLEYNAQWHGNGLIMYYVSGVSANESASGTITSPTIYLASKQNAPAWEELAWNQTLSGGAITLKIQKVVSGTWTDVSGLDNISESGNGLKTYDISALGSEDSIRVVATLTGASSPTLHDWAVSAGGCAAPQFTAELANAMTACTSGTTVLSATVEGSEPMTYQWQVSTNGGSSWGNVPAISIYNGINTPSLSIINPIPAYNGNLYRLKISNDCGSVISGTCTLTVQVCPANDHPTSGAGLLTSTNYVYPNCYQVNGSTVNATINPATGEKDVWYRFEAFSNGTSIRVSSTTMDAKVYLFDSADLSAPLKVVNQIQGGGTEILNYDGLTAGHLYRIAVIPADGVEGDFQICLQQLRLPLCDKTGTMSLCDLFKAKPTGATNINVSFTDDNENTVSTTTSTFVTLSQESLGLKPEWNYSVGLIANYTALVDGLGNPEPIVVANPEACSITIAPHAPVVLRAADRCSNLANLARNAYIYGTASNSCGVNGYKVEFVEMGACNGTVIGLPFEKTVLGSLARMSLNYVFNAAGFEGLTGIGYWRVRWKPRFGNGYYGTYSDAYVIGVNATAPGAGMIFDPSEASNGLTTGENISANIYPNPNNGDMVNINVTGLKTSTQDVYVRIMDAMGREVYTNRFEAEGSLNTIVSFSKPLASGLYMVEFTTGDSVTTQRMMVSK